MEERYRTIQDDVRRLIEDTTSYADLLWLGTWDTRIQRRAAHILNASGAYYEEPELDRAAVATLTRDAAVLLVVVMTIIHNCDTEGSYAATTMYDLLGSLMANAAFRKRLEKIGEKIPEGFPD